MDTAGMDDEGELGNLRVEKTYDVLRISVAGVSFKNREGIRDNLRNC